MGEMKRETPADAIEAFRLRHNLRQEDLDRLFGFRSKGRAQRRWKDTGAPAYVGVLMAYADRFGIDLMKELADAREAA